MDFFNTGTVEFKGLSLAVYDIVFLPAESYRMTYRETMEELYESIDRGLWKSKVFEDTIKLMTRIATNIPGRGHERPTARDMSRGGLVARAKTTLDHFLGERFEKAIAAMGELVEDMGSMPGMDELALEYLGGIHRTISPSCGASWKIWTGRSTNIRTPSTDPRRSRLFSRCASIIPCSTACARAARLRVHNRKAVWYRVAEYSAPSLEIRIQSKK